MPLDGDVSKMGSELSAEKSLRLLMRGNGTSWCLSVFLLPRLSDDEAASHPISPFSMSSFLDCCIVTQPFAWGEDVWHP